MKERPLPEPHPLALWGLWLAAAGAPLVYSNLFIARFTLPKLCVLSAGVLLSLLGHALSKGSLRLPPKPVGAALLACLAALVLSAAASQDRLLSLLGRYDSYAYGLWAHALCAVMLLLASSLPERRRAQTLTVLLAAGAAVACFGALEGLGMEFLPGIGALPEGRRAVSTLGSPVDLGAYLAALLPLALHEAFGGRSRPLGWLFLLTLAAGLVATASRGAWLGAAAGGAAYLLLSGLLKRARTPVLAAAGLALAAGLGLGALKLSSRATSASDAQRPLLIRTAWQAFLRRPLLGSGPDTFEQDFRRWRPEEYVRLMGSHRFQAYAHNDLFQALATTGLAGTAAFLALLLALGWAAKRSLDEPAARAQAAALAGGLIALFVVLKLNPVALEVLVTSAVLAGLLCPPPKAERPAAPPALLMSLLLLAALSTALAWRLASADLKVKEGKAKEAAKIPEAAARLYREGIALNPCELSYHILFVNLLSDRVNAAPTLPLRREVLAQGEALRSIACHASDVNAHYLRGIVLYLSAQVGRPELFQEAARTLDEALVLDPYFAPLLQSRIDAAKRMGDPAAAEFERRLQALPAPK